MAMSSDNVLDRATATLRRHTDRGWVAVRDDLLARALALFRPTAPIRGAQRSGEYFISAGVLTSLLREDVAALSTAGATHVSCTTDARHALRDVTIELIALYGAPLVPLAEKVRARAATTLAEVLGLTPEQLGDIPVHVGITDITDDPRRL
jgi:hypothetical protein